MSLSSLVVLVMTYVISITMLIMFIYLLYLLVINFRFYRSFLKIPKISNITGDNKLDIVYKKKRLKLLKIFNCEDFMIGYKQKLGIMILFGSCFLILFQKEFYDYFNSDWDYSISDLHLHYLLIFIFLIINGCIGFKVIKIIEYLEVLKIELELLENDEEFKF